MDKETLEWIESLNEQAKRELKEKFHSGMTSLEIVKELQRKTLERQRLNRLNNPH